MGSGSHRVNGLFDQWLENKETSYGEAAVHRKSVKDWLAEYMNPKLGGAPSQLKLGAPLIAKWAEKKQEYVQLKDHIGVEREFALEKATFAVNTLKRAREIDERDASYSLRPQPARGSSPGLQNQGATIDHLRGASQDSVFSIDEPATSDRPQEPAVPVRLQELARLDRLQAKPQGVVTPDRPPPLPVFPENEAQLLARFSFSARYTDLCKDRFLSSPVARLAQLGRHALRKRRWAVFEAKIMAEVGAVVNGETSWSAPISQMHLGKVLSVLEELPALAKAVTVLGELQANGKIVTVEAAPSKCDRDPFFIDTLTVTASLSAIATYRPTPVRGPGSLPHETHIKSELWVDVLSKSVKFPTSQFIPLWEMTHMFPGHAASGSSRSDFSALVVAANHEVFPFLIIESESNGFYSHKDDLVATSEAAYELNTICGQLCESAEDLDLACIFVGLISDATISFRAMRPHLDGNKICYMQSSYVRSFRLAGDGPLSDHIMNALDLVAFLRGPVASAGRSLAKLATAEVDRKYPYASCVPRLPPAVARSGPKGTEFTPCKDITL
ncbi:hypothetical protein HDU87_002936 [Geranomyces variabilis]|uniref:Uncharacterized protein n=1 Tax=Geranomyces variabilis TaxID=109894 RepID=A0AAD5XT00_9FUNG|nr:hypothetical protein HDU87_002936 [Geranomyces variabilis]